MLVYKYIIKLILLTDNGKFRSAYMFPIAGVFIGCFIIFMILSIMNSMEYQIEDRLQSFHYKYYLDDSDEIVNNDDFIKGSTTLGYINHDSQILVQIYSIDNFYNYLSNKLSNYIIDFDKNISNADIIIGDNLAELLNVELGDTIYLNFPESMNVATNVMPKEAFRIAAVYDIDFLKYDTNTIITSYQNELIINNHTFFYTDNADKYYKYKNNSIVSNIIIDALKFEKNIYYFFGIIVIMISCFAFSISIIQSIKEKNKQIHILNTLGLKNNKIKLFFLVNSIFASVLLSFIAIGLVNFVIYLYDTFNIFSFIYSSLPYHIEYIKVLSLETLILLLVVYTLTLLSTHLSLSILRKNEFY